MEILKETNFDNPDVVRLIENNYLLNLVTQIQSSNFKSQILEATRTIPVNVKPIREWTKKEIKNWAREAKNHPDLIEYKVNFIVEALAVIKQAISLDSNFDLTEAQIISCLVILHSKNDKGRLIQVNTGEGKSTIISVLAVIYALMGKYVDIITSSPVLAERDAKEKANFYDMFKLQCSDNSDKSIYVRGEKPCYKKPIVYGDVAQFQFDTLRNDYSDLKTLACRRYDLAIVDEVDSMLIDDSSKIARLATTIAGIDQLQIIYHVLWHELTTISQRIMEFDEKFYLFYGKISFQNEKIILEYTNERKQTEKISDLKDYVARTLDISHIGKIITNSDEFDVFIRDHLRNYITQYINKEYQVPKNFVGFVNLQIPRWIDSALIAYEYQENVHYVVHNGLIKPVDFDSTGIIQNFSNWSDGLHQFLQIKHNLKMTSATFMTNFLSNRGYFKKYRTNLFGLTGTLGSDASRKVLTKV
ncbi:unnamed protein product, partial [Rotaria sp. Silwood2]